MDKLKLRDDLTQMMLYRIFWVKVGDLPARLIPNCEEAALTAYHTDQKFKLQVDQIVGDIFIVLGDHEDKP